MQFQLVLQFQSDSLSHYDSMIALEEELIKELSNTANVDGHDMGSGQSNIFIISSDPLRTFRQVNSILDKKGYLQSMVAAYREVAYRANFYHP